MVSAKQNIGDDHLIAQIGIGEGFESSLPPFLDSVNDMNPLGTNVDALMFVGWLIAYQHAWNDNFRSNVSYRTTSQDNAPAQPDGAFHRNLYFVVDLIWSPLENRLVDIGIEYLWGFRGNKNGASADAQRLQLSAIFHLP